MDERVDGSQRALVRRVEPDDDARDGARAEADAHEMSRLEGQTVRYRVGEGARRAANAGKDRDLGSTWTHKS
jgi:hypothetical protein